MRRSTKLVLAITTMVVVMVTAFSYIFISELLRRDIATAQDEADRLNQQIYYLAAKVAPDLNDTRVDTDNPAEVRAATADALAMDMNLNAFLESVPGSWKFVLDAAIVDTTGKAILHTNSNFIGKALQHRESFKAIHDSGFRHQLSLVFNPSEVYDVSTPLQLNGAPFGTIHVGVSTVFLNDEVVPSLRKATVISITAILASLLLAAGLSHLALGPLERISRSLDSVFAGNPEVVNNEESRDEYGLVTLKIANLGQKMRDAKEIFSALKDNVDQIMANLQDGLMLFTRESRVVLVSASVERFLGRPRGEMLGRTAKEVFNPDTPIGAVVLEAFQQKRAVALNGIEAPIGKRVQLSLDFIQEGKAEIGALLTLRDPESVRRIEEDIETSRRLSASGRLTRGVAHEVKNPINAIVLHLQLLQSKLQQTDPSTRRHMDIIDSEIHRLDRVVQILVDFTRPRDLHLEEIDLRQLLEDVALLAAPEAAQHGITVRRSLPNHLLPVRADADLLKQAFLNVVINGIQAMSAGGSLEISASTEHDTVITEIQDQGGGIPPEIQEKIFELYFTTKKEGSGIGLAQTYQIMQWHYGSVEFESALDVGTTFRMRIPMVEARNGTLKEVATGT
jgi:signal transduction histidine kinase